MPAIELARLKTQAARLAEKSGDPQAFVHDLDELLDAYTNRTIRARQVVRRLAAPTYHTPRPVMRQIEYELDLLVESQPAQAAGLVGVLWEAGSLESRLLAAYLLGSLPLAEARPALTHLTAWLAGTTDRQIQAALLTTALARLRREDPAGFFAMLEGWLGSAQAIHQIWGMQALIPLLQDERFENLPAVFHILRPAILAAVPATQLDLQACLAALEAHSRVETASFLREIITDHPQPSMLRILRRILPALSREMQDRLRGLLRERII